MFRSPRPRTARAVVHASLTAVAFALCLSALAPLARAQQLSLPGIQSPVKEEPSVKQEATVEVRAAQGFAPLARLYNYLKAEPAKVRRLPALTLQDLREEKRDGEKRLRVGAVRTFPQSVKASSDSTLYSLAEGDVRVMELVSEGALYTRVHFGGMILPAGARVFVYSAKNPDDFYGPYEGRGASEDGTFWTPPIEGDRVVIEYLSPRGTVSQNDAPFQVSEISHIYRSIFTDTNDAAGSCNLDVTSEWAEVAKAVGYLEFTSGGSEFSCTGTLLNNQANDFAPFLLTANHCFNTQTEAQTLRVYWNYNTGNIPPSNTPHTDGANLLATGTGSDFTFVRLTGTLPTGLFFSGWDASPTPLSTSVTGIHHPEGSYKRISFGNTISGCGSGLSGPCQNFTNVRWSSGTTEEGSSGSGIWKGTPADPKLVGTLTGGASSCSTPTGTDYYGSFSVTYPSISSFLAGGTADLSITNSTAYDQVAPGSRVVYLLTVTNSQGSAVGTVSVTDNLPSELTFVSCGASGGTCGGTGNSRTISFPSLAVGASAMAVLTATVNNSVASGTVISNTATVSSSSADSNQSNNNATASATVSLTPFKPRGNGKIVFGSDRAFSNSTQPTAIYTIAPDGTNESVLLNVEPFASAAAWSPDGTRIAYGKRAARGTYGDEIYIANADGTGSVRVASNVYDQNSRIAWSPTGTKLAFIGTGSSIYTVNADGTGLSKLPSTPSFANDLAWSPDGSKFAYAAGDIFVMNIDGTGQTNLTQGRINLNGEGGRSVLPRWSPDGTRILFGTESINYRFVYVMNADGTGLSQLISLHQSMQPAWSPDGTRISFIALNSLYVANADGTGQQQLTNNGFYNFKPDWQPTAAPAPTVQLSAASYSAGEVAGNVAVIVNRTNASTAASVDYSTTDTSGLTACSQVTGVASSRCDYANTVGTLRFAAGETSKTIFIPLVDDGYVEGNESFTIRLSNPVGAGLGTNSTATITIMENDAAPSNPVVGVPFFVRQQYIDFLGREPDAGGYAAWQNILNNCKSGDTSCDRISVSAGFFRSPEFQDRGYFIYKFYSAALGRTPRYSEFMPDLAKVSGFLSDAQLEANKAAFVSEFMTRTEFANKYGALSNTAFVDTLIQTSGLTSHPLRDAWVGLLNSGGATRAQVLRAFTESLEVYNKFYTESFVVMQYFGYLRRDPDASYLQWIQIMNTNGGDFRGMISGFMNSNEYVLRFGP